MSKSLRLIKIMDNQLKIILEKTYQFAPGLNKHIFMWDKTPKSLKVLAGTDNSGIVKFCNKEYYVYHNYKENKIIIENN